MKRRIGDMDMIKMLVFSCYKENRLRMVVKLAALSVYVYGNGGLTASSTLVGQYLCLVKL